MRPPPISVLPVAWVSAKGTELLHGSVQRVPPRCDSCRTRPCLAGPPQEATGICPWGYEYLRLTSEVTVIGGVTFDSSNMETPASAKVRRTARQAGEVLVPRAAALKSAERLRSWLQTEASDLDLAVQEELSRRIDALTVQDAVEPLRDELQRHAAMNHDYVKVAAGIRANMERIRRDVPQVAQRPEWIAIEGAALRLEDLPSLHTLLSDRHAMDRWPDKTPHRVFAAADSYYHWLKHMADGRGVTLLRPSCIQGQSTSEVYGSRRAFGGIILQLLDNAISYSEPGETVTTVIDEPADGGTVRISVSSFGPKIAEDEFTKIFLPGYRGKAARQARDGSGIGLAVLEIATKGLGGSVSVSQQPGGGPRLLTTFSVTLPRHA